MDTIKLEGMAFYGYHGADSAENALGQRFFIDVEMKLELSVPGKSDQLEDSVDYAEVFQITKKVVEGRPCRLLERVAALVNEEIMAHYPSVQEVKTTIHKPGAPIQGIFRDVMVTLHKKR